ncbi:MAG: helix-turn-helix domain-containing protein [Sphingomonadales bacterium]|nr:helix-turn-helix domain-containing protein [Sphingomonadales bacterium]
MPAAKASSNKAKIARRVIEVLEYFDDNHREATVMDIVRRYNRPQSSTSELLSSLVDLGMLYKDPYSRSYSLTPRAALLGSVGQTDVVRDGRLVRLIDRLVAQTGLNVAVFGMVGLNAQIINWRTGTRGSSPATRNLFGGMQEALGYSAPGWLLMSTIAQPRCDGVVRRLISEAPEDRKFAFADMAARLTQCRETGHAQGPVGFGTAAESLVALLPDDGTGHRLAVGFVYSADSRVQSEALIECLNEGIRHCLLQSPSEGGQVEHLQTAA